jgi:integrase
MPKSWAAQIPMPDDPGGLTLPFTDDEIEKLLAACNDLREGGDRTAEEVQARAKALLLVLLYTGLRISDVVKLERRAVDDQGRILLYMKKTGEPVRIKLRPMVLEALAQLPARDGLREGYFFWNAGAKLGVQCNGYRKVLQFIMKHAGLKNVRPHRFRDTFAQAVLDSGHDLSTLQLLLGHKRYETTDRSYRHFSQKQQAIMDAAIDSLPDFGQGPRPAGPHTSRYAFGDAQRNVIAFRPAARVANA